MTSSKTPTVFVSMATGAQGGAVCKYLQELGWDIRATVRDLASPNAQALLNSGAHLTLGDWDNQDALRAALEGCDKAFIGFATDLLDLQKSTERTQNMVGLCKAAGVQQAVVTTTLGTAMVEDIPPALPTPLFQDHFVNKRHCEKLVEEGGFDYWTVLRPAFFMSNFLDPKVQYGYADTRDKGVWANSLLPETKLGLIDHEYIGKAAVAAFQEPERFHGRRLALVTEELLVQETLDQLAAAIGDGRSISAYFMTDEEIEEAEREGSWAVFSREKCVRYLSDYVNLTELNELVPGLTTFKEFLEREKATVKSTYLAKKRGIE